MPELPEVETVMRGLAAALSGRRLRDGQWSMKGFIDIFRNIYKALAFAEKNDRLIVLPEHQNYYPDISFVSKSNRDIRFALDFKTTYRNPLNP